MSEESLLAALDTIQSKSREDVRAKAAEEFKEDLQRFNRAGGLPNKTCNTVFDALVKKLRSAQLEFNKTKAQDVPKSAKGKARKILAVCTDLVRHVVTAGVRRMRHETMKFVLEFILEIVANPSSSFFGPVSHEYTKCLRVVLDFAPHVEHLEPALWNDVARVCLNLIPEFSSYSNGHNGTPSLSTPRPTTPMEPESTEQSEVVIGSQRQRVDTYGVGDDLVACIRNLARAPNATLSDLAEPILSTLTEWLSTKRSNQSQVEAFAAINAVILKVHVDSITIVQQAISRLIPLVKTSWSTKLSALKDEMLITLVYSQAHVAHMLRSPNHQSASVRSEIASLVEIIGNDSVKRGEREQLQMDDLRLKCAHDRPREQTPFTLPAFQLKQGNLRSEQNWAKLYLTAYFSNLLDASRPKRAGSGANEKKRSRGPDHLEDYIRQVSSPQSSMRLHALQIASFMVQQVGHDVDTIRVMLERLVVHTSDPTMNNWAMLGIAACAMQSVSASAELQPLWVSAWQLSSRNLGVVSSSRVAAHLMDVIIRLGLVDSPVILETLDAIVSSVELNGPANLDEASASLWVSIFDLRCAESPHSLDVVSERMIRWLFSKWDVCQSHSRSRISCNYDVWDVMRVLCSVMDRPLPSNEQRPFFNLGPVALSWLRVHQRPQLVDYLLLVTEPEGFLAQPRQIAVSTQRSTSNEKMVLDFCISHINQAIQHLEDHQATRASPLSPEMITSIMVLCMVSEQLSWANVNAAMEPLRPSSDKLVSQLSSFVTSPACDQLLVDIVLENLAPSLPALDTIKFLDAALVGGIATASIVKQFSRALLDRKGGLSNRTNDAMEIDDEFNSQASRQITKSDVVDFPRDLLAAKMSLQTSRASVTSRLLFLASALEADDAARVPPAFLDHVVSLPPVDFMSCVQVVLEVLSSPLLFTSKDCDTLLGYAVDEVMTKYDHERSEAALGLFISLLAVTVVLWSDVASEAFELGTDLYRWLLKALSACTECAVVLVQASDFICKLLEARPDSEVLDARSDLLQILQQGNVQVKYHVIESLPQVFGLYNLDVHEEIFESIHESLPGSDSSIEEIALRMLGYARLGAKWPSLLRRCVYHIFETVGLVQESCRHADRCTTWLSKELGLEGPRALFRIFASQLVHTWINGEQKLGDIPYAAFGYDDLPSLVRDVKGEVYSQLAMFGKRDEINFLVDQLQVAEADLAFASLPKTAAYIISYDTRPNKGEEPQELRESAMKKLLGESRWMALIGQQFPCILAIALYTMWMKDPLEKHIERHSQFRPIAPYLREMQELSSLDANLPDDQQPVFRSKFIFDQIKRICRRASFNEASFWTPDCYTYVLRYLLSKIHPALGSLHACSVIRKIRFLVALAGPVVWEGYPLQMSLGSLRPYLTDSHCVQDTIGILQYLFTHGKPYLMTNLPCLAGNAIPILLSLNGFVSSGLENTMAVQKATEFHQWFKSYVESCIHEMERVKLDRDRLKGLRTMAKSAGEMQAPGNATVDTHESELLMALLTDSSSQNKVLDDPTRDLAFDFLFRHFEPPSSFRQDVLGSAGIASAYSLQVWNSSQKPNSSREYLLWAAKVLGRSYSACGEVKEAIRRTARSSHGVDIARKTGNKTSRWLIAAHLHDLLLGNQPYRTGLAEQTLRAILTSDRNQQLLPEIGQPMPLVVVESLTMNEAYRISLSQPEPNHSLEESLVPNEPKELSSWIADLCISLASLGQGDGMVEFLPRLLSRVESSAEELFPYILHLVLEREFGGDETLKKTISNAFGTWFERCTKAEFAHVKAILRAILYLRTRKIPKERTIADRVQWLDINYQKAAEAAVTCGMYTAALLFAECHSDQTTQTSRRSSVMPQNQPISLELQLSIYRNLEEPDSFYGVEQEAGLSSVLDRLDYESDGLKGLLFHGAQMDSHFRMSNNISMADSGKIVKDLTMLNLSSLTHSLLDNDKFRGLGSNLDYTLEAAQKLEQWDIRAPFSKRSGTSALYKAFQGVHNSNDLATVRKHLDQSFLETMEACSGLNASAKTLHDSFRAMAALNEIDEIMSSKNEKELDDTWGLILQRTRWFTKARVEDFRPIISSRETLFSLLSKQPGLQDIVKTEPADLRFYQKEALEHSVDIFRRHGALQESLTAATYLVDLVEPCRKVNLETEFDAKFQVALVLWDQGEKTASVRMLQQLEEKSRNSKEHLEIRAKLLTTLGIYTSEARLKKPDEITGQYMAPAIKSLRNKRGKDAGRAYHAYAAFCDQQIQNQDLVDDHHRMQTLAERRKAEAHEYERQYKAEKSSSRKEHLKREARKAHRWFTMDMQEAHRLGESRLRFLRGALENYLLALQASDEHDKDVFRMFSLWLEYENLALANTAVGDHIGDVPKGKFVVLMNQLSSKLSAEESQFQTILSNLVARICANHPYHGMNHIYSGSKGTGKDEAAKLRSTAAIDIAHKLKRDAEASVYWGKIYRANEHYHAMALMNEKEFKSGKDYTMAKYPTSARMITTIPTLQIPPITLHMPVLAHLRDYEQQPYITGFKPIMGIANGLSQPKVVTALGSDGKQYKQLYKSGNDDLRQDAIMEQVFEHVSQLLGSHPATRLRNLQIRTYRVVPLSPRTGVIEFVQNTQPLMAYLDSAHQAYYPKDWKQNKCREVIAAISAHSHEERIKEYKRTCKNFNPVMRYFFLERFPDPDDWFEKRLAYSRSTAAISILGHVLGLGDRHCHNILLDQMSGEVVHIDLGVAFEAGRVLPVPEVVPFRLTRDIVDAMGSTGVEGVFRRCCEFTLDTLRDERDSIMTILNVLRYDPLYSWSISPLKAKKMQEADKADAAGEEWEEQQILRVASRKTAEEGVGEAGRALSVVERKLSKALSSAAAVAELIQQATDERNLAVLYAGWSAWC